VGRTPNVSGSLTISGTQVTAATITADLTTLQSDDQRRDGQLARQGIQTSQFPTATFKLTSPIELGSVPADGKEIQVTASGQLTLHGQTKDVQIPLKARLSGSTIAISGSLPIAFADYGIQKPNSFMVLSIADEGTMELQLFFTRA
jgi:polyisoprenoid-binding protein YceI